jgi:hypothetical protein
MKSNRDLGVMQTHQACTHKSGDGASGLQSPLPQKRTSIRRVGVSALGHKRPFFPASNEDAANRNNKSNQAEYSKLTNRPAWRSAGQKLTAATAGPLATVCIAAETRGRPAPSPIQTRRHPQRKTCSRHTPWKPHWATQFLSMELR